MYHVYILQSQKDLKFYAGLTNDLERRLTEHNGGYVKPTRGRRPLVIVYSEKCDNLVSARAREKFFKSGAGREFRDNVLKQINIPR